MYGNTLTRAARGITNIVLKPRDGLRWMADRARPQSPLESGLAWVSWAALDFLRDHVKPGMRVFEWGGGGSTVFFADLGAHVTCVETNRGWADKIAVHCKKFGERVDIRLIQAEEDPAKEHEYYGSVSIGHPWDMILVDNWEGGVFSRMRCAEVSRRSVKPGGLIILDDAWRQEYKAASRILDGFSRRVFRGLGPARWGVTQTDIYTSER